MNTLSRILASLIIALIWSVGFGMISDTQAGDHKIVANPETNMFEPQVMKIKVGDQITWMNESRETHYMASDGPLTKQFVKDTRDTEVLEFNFELPPGAIFSYVFNKPGTYNYFCGVHIGMWGTVVVEE